MRMSFDLDGVITDSEKWFFGILSTLRQMHNKELLDAIEILYYSTRQIRYNPFQFLSARDEGFIITARKPISHAITESWLLNHAIYLPIIYVDPDNSIDWIDYMESSYESAKRKVDIMGLREITTHLDNNPYIVTKMRQLMPSATIIQIGGEPCQPSM